MLSIRKIWSSIPSPKGEKKDKYDFPLFVSQVFKNHSQRIANSPVPE